MKVVRLHLIHGDEAFLRQRLLREILETAGASEGDLDYEEIIAGTSKLIDWVSAASTVPFMADRRTVVVRQLLRAEVPEGEKAVELLRQIPTTGCLVLVVDDEVGESTRQESLIKAWSAAVKKAEGAIHLAAIKKGELGPELQRFFHAHQKQIAPNALAELMDMTGGNLSAAMSEAEKLILYVGDSKSISAADVRLVTTPSREWRAFAYTDAIVHGRAAEALNHLRTLAGKVQRADEAGPRFVVPMIHRQIRLLWQARALLDTGATPDNAQTQAPESLVAQHNLATAHDFVKTKTMQQARKVTMSQVCHAMDELCDLDARLKGILPVWDQMEALERSTLRLVQVFSSARESVAGR
jgi:DNA polymerase-3 subunit delta